MSEFVTESEVYLVPMTDFERELLDSAARTLWAAVGLTDSDKIKEQAECVGAIASRLRYSRPIRLLDEDLVAVEEKQ